LENTQDSKNDSDNGVAFTVGNAIDDGRRGWFIGQFLDPETGLRHRHDVEVKWGAHQKGASKAEDFAFNERSTTISILIEGIFHIMIKSGEEVEKICLSKPGDYLILNAGVPHSWEAETECVVLSIRTPSIAGDQRGIVSLG
jgi:hypothetical protein